MPRLIIAATVIAVVLTVYAIIDCAVTEPGRARGLRKPAWIAVILLVPLAGPLLWLLLGKLRGDARRARLAPDDDEAFLRSLDSDAAHQERIRKLEEEIAALDEQPGAPGAGTASRGPRQGAARDISSGEGGAGDGVTREDGESRGRPDAGDEPGAPRA